jgi:glycosyltransferase involved in cell wall biosynthesis
VPSLSISVLVRNEEKRLPDLLNSVKDFVDEIVIVDTSSTDNTIEVARQFTDKIYFYTPETHPYGFVRDEESGLNLLVGFCEARQLSFNMTTADYNMFADADDIIYGAEELPRIVAELEPRGFTQAAFRYYYWLHKPTEFLWVNRIIKRGIVPWESSIHAHLDILDGQCGYYHAVQWRHMQGEVRNETVGIKRRNYKCLKYWYDHGDREARTLYYLGIESALYNPRESLNWYNAAEQVAWEDPRHRELQNIKDKREELLKANPDLAAEHFITKLFK